MYEHEEVELEAYLQKKNSKGFYQQRYFVTSLHQLYYYASKEAFKKKDAPSQSYDVRDIRSQEKGARILTLVFTNDKFQLQLLFASELECQEWSELLAAKRKLHSVHELMERLRQGARFATPTFAALMVLPEADQFKYVQTQLNDTFEAAHMKTEKGGSNKRSEEPIFLLQAARTCVSELVSTAKDCEIEMRSRDPHLITHCRRFVRRYCDAIKSRLLLEIMYIVREVTGARKRLEEIGERALCEAIGLMLDLDKLLPYTFISNNNFVQELAGSLFSIGELTSSLLNLCIERVNEWFSMMLQLAPSQRASRLMELNRLLLEIFKKIQIDADEDGDLQRSILTKIATTSLLIFSDHLAQLSLDEHCEEEALLAHIRACQFVFSSIGNCISWTVDVSEQVDSCQPSSYTLALPEAVLDAVKSSSLFSARQAAVVCVQNFGNTALHLFACLFQEKAQGWLGGTACSCLITYFDQWISQVCSASDMPAAFSIVLKSECGRLLVRLYLQRLVVSYQDDKRIKLSERGVAQVDNDLVNIHSWLMRNLGDRAALEEQHLVIVIREWLICGDNLLLKSFNDAVQVFGINLSLHLYDVLRLCLKLRVDFSSKQRKSILGLCSEFLRMLQEAEKANPSLFCGQIHLQRGEAVQTRLLEYLSPLAGIEHCTGKAKWSLEKVSDPVAVRILVAARVAEACTNARAQRMALAREKEEAEAAEEAARKTRRAAAATIAEEPAVVLRRISARHLSMPLMAPPPTPPRIPKIEEGKEEEEETKEALVSNPPLPPPPPPRPISSTAVRRLSAKLENLLQEESDRKSSGNSPLPPPRAITKISTNPFGDEDEEEETTILPHHVTSSSSTASPPSSSLPPFFVSPSNPFGEASPLPSPRTSTTSSSSSSLATAAIAQASHLNRSPALLLAPPKPKRDKSTISGLTAYSPPASPLPCPSDADGAPGSGGGDRRNSTAMRSDAFKLLLSAAKQKLEQQSEEN